MRRTRSGELYIYECNVRGKYQHISYRKREVAEIVLDNFKLLANSKKERFYKWDVKGHKNPRRKFVCFQSEAGKYSPRPRTSFDGANFRDRTRQTLNNEPAANEHRSLYLECVTRARRSLGDIKYLINIPIVRRIARVAVARL